MVIRFSNMPSFLPSRAPLPRLSRRRAVVFIMLFAAAVLSLLPVFAGPVTFLQSLAKQWLEDILGGTLTDNALYIFSKRPWESSSGAGSTFNPSGAWSVAESINKNVIQPVGYSLVGICFTIRVARAATDFEHVTAEKIFTPFIQMLGCMIMVSNAYTLMLNMISIGVALAVRVQNQAVGLLGVNITALTAQMMPDFDQTHGIFVTQYLGELWDSAILVAQLLLPHLAYKVVSFLIKIISYGVIIELIVRGSLFPLFGGDIMLHGFEGAGMRYLKSFMAVCAQGAVIVLIAAIQNSLNASALSQVVGGSGNALKDIATITKAVGKILVFDFSAVALMLKSSQITREVLGV